MERFAQFVFSPAGLGDPAIAIAACRAGGIGVVDGQFGADDAHLTAALDQLAEHAGSAFGVRLPASPSSVLQAAIASHADAGLRWLIVDRATAIEQHEWMQACRLNGQQVLIEIGAAPDSGDDSLASRPDGWIARGQESGGCSGQETAFALTRLVLDAVHEPVYVRGGVGIHTAAACAVLGAAGIVLDQQLLLLRESPLGTDARDYLQHWSGDALQSFEYQGARWTGLVPGTVATAQQAGPGWLPATGMFLPLGADASLAADWEQRFASVGRVLAAQRRAVADYPAIVQSSGVLKKDSPFARSRGTSLPLVQAPLTHITCNAAFAERVSDAGGLPVIAAGLTKSSELSGLLADVRERLGERPFGLALLGSASPLQLAEQLDACGEQPPALAIVCGDSGKTAHALDRTGVPTYAACASAAAVEESVRAGGRRFLLQGHEAGGPVGRVSALTLWEQASDTLLALLDEGLMPAADLSLLLAADINDARSAAAAACTVALLAERGVQIGFMAGSAYLRTADALECECVTAVYQKLLQKDLPSALVRTGEQQYFRALQTPCVAALEDMRERLEAEDTAPQQITESLVKMIHERTRLAAQGKQRSGADRRLRRVAAKRQQQDGIFPAGRLAGVAGCSKTVADLHQDLSDGALEHLSTCGNTGVAAVREEAAPQPCDIAIVGIGCVLPGARGAREFWQNIIDRTDAISEIPSHRWDWRLYFDEDRNAPDKIYSRWGGFLDDLPFNPLDYGIPPTSIKAVDPLQLMTLEVLRQALEDAGYLDAEYDREKVSVILGASGGAGDVGAQYAVRSETTRFKGELDERMAERLPVWTEDSFAGILLNVAAGRAANRFDFGGLNFTVDAACASSLTAIYQAVAELESHRSDMVLAGGIDTVQGPFGYLCFSKTQALSPRGKCSTFDVSADGIVISEGLAAVALKRLTDAERDGDRIYSVIKGVGGSSDGRAKSMTAPFPDGQVRALRRAYAKAGYDAGTVGLFEAHGTGTVAGDTAELETVSRVLAASGAQPKQAAIGSVKTLIGHTKATAGVAGLIKSALALYHQTLPPHANVTQPNARISDPESPLYLVREAQPWIEGAQPRRASVSAFGFGGTNFHVTMEEHGAAYLPRRRPAVMDCWPAELLIWRASDHASLGDAVARTLTAVEHCERPLCVRDMAYTLWQDMPADGLVAAVTVAAGEDVATRIRQLIARVDNPGRPAPPGLYYSASPLGKHGKVAAVFAGQGSQYPNMLREIALAFPGIVDTMQTAEEVIGERITAALGEGETLSRQIYTRGLYSPEDEKAAAASLMRTNIAQPALGVVEAGLWQLMQRLGLRPDMSAGHSYGEYAALYAAGVLTLEDLLRISEARGRYIVEAADGSDLGAMAAVMGAREDVERVAAAYDDLIVANHNAPQQSILSGSGESIDAVVTALAAEGIEARRLTVGAAFHSSFVAPARDRLADRIEELDLQPAEFPVYSNTTAAPHDEDLAVLRATLSDHLAKPVEFVAEIEAMYADGARIFVGLGPKNVQNSLVQQILGDRPHAVIRIDDQEGGLKGLVSGIGALLAEGVSMNLAPLYAGRGCRRVNFDRPATLSRALEYPSHVWMLNGSGARRIGDPLPVPLTLEQVEKEKRDEQVRDQRVQNSTTAAEPLPMQTRQNETTHNNDNSKEEGNVAEKTAPPIEGEPLDTGGTAAVFLESERDGVLLTYQDTMRQFLQTQENIMMAYLTGASATRTVRQVRPVQRIAAPAARLAPLQPAAPQPPAVRPANGVATQPQTVAAPPAGNNGSATAMSSAAPANGAAAASNGSANGTQAASNGAALAANGAAASNGTAAKGNGSARNGAATKGAVKTAGNGASSGATNGTAAAAPAAALNADGFTRLLLDVVEDRTGYPRDMLGMDQNMEADLGIDSIKRVEIVGALLKTLPQTYVSELGEDTEELNSQSTLQGIVDWLANRAGGEAASSPFEHTGEGNADTGCAPLPRFIVQAQPESLGTVGLETLDPGIYLIVDEGSALGDAVLAELNSLAVTTMRVVAAELSDPAKLGTRLDEARSEHGPVRGVVHLLGATAEPVAAGSPLATWQQAIERNEESLCRVIALCAEELQDGGRIVAATGLGGNFARGLSSSSLAAQGGAVGLLKSLNDEWPATRVRAVDLDASRPADANAQDLLREMRLPGGRLEVGYPGGKRTVFRTLAAPFAEPQVLRTPDGQWVVLATGGARGITAEVLNELAPAGVTLVIVGRTPPPEAEDEATSSCATPADLRRALLQQARDEGRKPRPVEIEWRVSAVLRDREILANLAGFRAAGATVDYRVADVRDEAAMQGLFESLYNDYGRVDGIVHGAGIIEDKLFLDKTPESRARVIATKVESAWIIARNVRVDSLQFLVFFTSVAGRYGNTGQTDYASANEMLNRLAWQLAAQWEGKVKVAAMNWGPWLGTSNGPGMVSDEARRKFEGRGVTLVPPATGRQLFIDEIHYGPVSDVEIVAGAGPWEKHECDIGALRAPGNGAHVPANLPLMNNVQRLPAGEGEVLLSRRIDTATDRYLEQHMIDNVPVLPAAVALELMAEAVASNWTDYVVTEVSDFRALRGIVLDDGPRDILIAMRGTAAVSTERQTVAVELRPVKPGPPYYRAQVHMDRTALEPSEFHSVLQPGASPLSAKDAYRDLLFHGPCFQTVPQFLSLDEHGCLVESRASVPSDWLSGEVSGEWLFDPGVVDSAPQMALVWAHAIRQESALPSRFGRVRRFGNGPLGPCRMHFLVYPDQHEHQVRADVAFVNQDGQLRLLIEELECTSSPALNRLGGAWKGELVI